MLQKIFKISLICLIVISFIVFLKHASNNKTGLEKILQSEDTFFVQGEINGFHLKFIVANELPELIKGLSEREKMADNEGMLFVFTKSAVQRFWMKDMFFPIDIIWLDENLTVLGVSENAEPKSYALGLTFSSIIPARYVLEINAGQAKNLGVKKGTSLVIDY